MWLSLWLAEQRANSVGRKRHPFVECRSLHATPHVNLGYPVVDHSVDVLVKTNGWVCRISRPLPPMGRQHNREKVNLSTPPERP